MSNSACSPAFTVPFTLSPRNSSSWTESASNATATYFLSPSLPQWCPTHRFETISAPGLRRLCPKLTSSPPFPSPSPSSPTPSPPPAPESEIHVTVYKTGEEVINRFWECTITGNYSDTIDLFTDDAVYNDLNYPKPKVGKDEIRRFLTAMEPLFSSGSILFKIDQQVANDTTGSVRWHLETTAGKAIPNTRGGSFYHMVKSPEDGSVRIKEVFDFVESPVKPGNLVAPFVKAAASLLNKMK